MRSFSGWQRALLFAGTFSLAFVLAACGGGGNAASGGASTAGTPSAGAPSADRNAALRVAVNYTFSLYDPHRVVRAADTTYLRPVYDSLLTVVKNASGTREPGPRLTTSYVVAPDGLSIEFVLRENVTFQDGTPFNAAAVQANIERAQGPDSTVASKLKSIKTIEVRDPTHVVFQLSEPDPTLPWTMATDSAGMMVSPAAFNTDLATTPVGAGPFTLVSATKDADSVYKRWDGYWDKDAALVQSLTISSIADGNVRLNGLRSGQFDLVSLLAPQDYQAQSLQGEGYHYLSALGPTSYGVLLNSAKPPFNDVRVRRAVSMSVNRTEQSTQLTHGLYPPAYQAFNPGVLGHDPSLNNDPYNPDEARRLVQEAGADGASITVIQSLYQPADQLAQVVQQALGDIGLHATLVPVTAAEARPKWYKGEDNALVATITAQPEPSQTLALSYLGGDNPAPPPAELVAMAQKAKSLPLGSAERTKAYQDISAYLQQNPVHVPILQLPNVLIGRPNVIGMSDTLLDNLGDFRSVGIGK